MTNARSRPGRQAAPFRAAAPDELRRSDLAGPGIRRRRCGRGLRYLGPDGAPVRDPEQLARIKSLVIPPAWEDVWICADRLGHIQAVGTDSAGRRQYRYHDLWRDLETRTSTTGFSNSALPCPGSARWSAVTWMAAACPGTGCWRARSG